MNNGLFTSDKNYWETPKNTFDKWDRLFHFTLDVCASDKNAKCEKYYTAENSCLDKDWSGEVCWMNPPYGRDIHKFVRKAAEESLKGVTTVALLPARTDTAWFHTWVFPYARKIYLIPGRLKFELNGQPGGSAPFPSMIVVFGKKMDKEPSNGYSRMRKAIAATIAGFNVMKGRTEMQFNAKTAATFGSGLAIGVVVGIFAEVAFEKWQDRKAAEKFIVNPVEPEDETGIEESDIQEIEPDRNPDTLAENPNIKRKDPNHYSKNYRVYEREESDKAVFDGDLEQKTDEIDRSIPTIITGEEYLNGKPSYDKVECTYAEDENGIWVLTNDDGNVEMDIRETIGMDALGYFHHEPELEEGEGTVYVRNDLLGADYCVMKYPYVE